VRVLQVTNFYPPYWVGGYELIASWVTAGLRDRGHEVEVLTGRGPAFSGVPGIRGDLDLGLDGLVAAYFGDGIVAGDGLAEGVRRHVFSARNFAACRRAIDEFRPDLVSFWNPAFVTFSPLLAARQLAVPSLVHLSDTAANPFRNPHAPRFPRRLRRAGRAAVDALLRFSRPSRYVVPSAFLRDKLVSRESLPAARTVVLRWPVEPVASGCPDGASVHRGASRLLFVGTLIPEKGPDVLVAAVREAVRACPGLSLTFVGDGPAPFVARLRDAARGLDVRFLGRLDRAGVVGAYREHDVLVFPSVWDEPFAVVPLEAMALGLAVVASRAGGTPEAVIDGETGLLVPPGDAGALAAALLRLAREPERARALAARGSAWARREQGFAAFMDRLETLYASTAEGRPH
jgi:glycosyltransferase involved in cell wall biosynthesis